MTDTGDIIGGAISLGIGLIALDTVRHISKDIIDNRDKKSRPKQREENYFRI